MQTPKDPRRKKPKQLIVLRCPACRSFVAASRDAKLLELAQRHHVCPESLAFASRNGQTPEK